MEPSNGAGGIEQILSDIDSSRPLTKQQQDKYLDTLESYECWEPYLKLINRKLKSDNSCVGADFARLARVRRKRPELY